MIVQPRKNAKIARELWVFHLKLLVIILCLLPWVAFGLGVGSTREEVVEVLGEPTATARKGPTEMLYYSGGVIDIRAGKVARLDSGFDTIIKKRAKGLVKYDGRWMTTNEAERLEGIKAVGLAEERAKAKPVSAGRPISDVNAPDAGKIEIVANGGKAVDLSSLLVPGKVTIVDFYADWCGPCRAMSPTLEGLASQDADVYLRKVDIVNWSSEVTAQYALNSIPNVRVYDRRGRLVGEPTASPQAVVRFVHEAK